MNGEKVFVELIVKTREPETWSQHHQSRPGGYFEIAPVSANRCVGGEALPAPANEHGVMLRSWGPSPSDCQWVKDGAGGREGATRCGVVLVETTGADDYRDLSPANLPRRTRDGRGVPPRE